MEKKQQESGREGSEEHYDMSEESSKRGSDEATSIARREENDDVNEYNGAGPMNSEKSGWAENKVSTSLDEESAS